MVLTAKHTSRLIDWVNDLRPTRHKIGHFGDVPQADLLAWCGSAGAGRYKVSHIDTMTDCGNKGRHIPYSSVRGCSFLCFEPTGGSLWYAWPTLYQTYGYLPSGRSWLPIDWYRMILLGDGGTRCEQLAHDCNAAVLYRESNSGDLLRDGKFDAPTTPS